INAAKAVGLDRMVGSLEAGKRADLVVRHEAASEAQPGVDRVHQLALSGRAQTIDTVIIDGDIVFRGGHCTRLDEEVVYAAARRSVNRIFDRLGIRPYQEWLSSN